MVNFVPRDPLVSACRQCLAGQRILEAQGKNVSAFFPFALCSGWVLDSTVWEVLSRTEDGVFRDHPGDSFLSLLLTHPPALGSTIP